MKGQPNIILTSIMIIYLAIIILTPFSFIGFWTDVLFTIGIVIFSIAKLNNGNIDNKVLRITHRLTTIGIAIIVIGIVGIHLINPFLWTVYKTKIAETTINGNYIELDYFKPIGAWGCGNGSYWKTKTLKYFPIIEFETYKNNCTHEDWGYYIKTGKWE